MEDGRWDEQNLFHLPVVIRHIMCSEGAFIWRVWKFRLFHNKVSKPETEESICRKKKRKRKKIHFIKDREDLSQWSDLKHKQAVGSS